MECRKKLSKILAEVDLSTSEREIKETFITKEIYLASLSSNDFWGLINVLLHFEITGWAAL